MIISNPYGGLCNRLKCLLSSMRIDDDIKLVWDYKTYDGGVWCKFGDLFENNYEEFFSIDECVKHYPNIPIYKSCEFFKFDDEEDANQHFVSENRMNDLSEKVRESYFEQINKLIPVKYVRDEVESFSTQFDSNTITVSVRTWKDLPRTRETMGKHFSIETLFSIMDEYPNNKLFVTCDDQETFEMILNRYGNQIIYTKKRTTFGDYHTSEGLQDSLIDLYLGGKNDLILPSYGSSYSEMQWWFGGGKSRIRVMNLQTK